MAEAQARSAGEPPRQRGGQPGRCYAALDLGTNNCRLLIAQPAGDGFRVLEAFSRIVRLGEGLSHTGKLQEAAMERAMAALHICADKVRRRRVAGIRAVATQACRAADNGPDFVERVAKETGLKLQVISPREEARLSVAGCRNLLDYEEEAALVLDVGGGSTELSWVDLRGSDPSQTPPVRAWLSVPVGVVTLAENFPETGPGDDHWYRAMVDHVRSRLDPFRHADVLRPVFDAGRAHLVGTSGAITSLAGLHLGLRRYDRSRVDGLWLEEGDCRVAAERLLRLHPEARAAEPCIGPDRADLVLAGAAILQAVQETWPCRRVRVADRGLREGLLLSLMSGGPRRRGGRKRGGRKDAAS